MRSIPEALNSLTKEVRAANELRAEQNKLLARQASLLEKQTYMLMPKVEDGVSVAGREFGDVFLRRRSGRDIQQSQGRQALRRVCQ